MNKETIIKKLALSPHPEGGWYREFYKNNAVGKFKTNEKVASTQIYYLMSTDSFSHLHRLTSSEIWNFHFGSSVNIHFLDIGRVNTHKLGLDLNKNELPCIICPEDTWFAAEPIANSDFDFSLVSCNVSPGFEFDDFSMGYYDDLTKLYPEQNEFIEKFAFRR